ncbi:MAG TPA: hypothetical protein VF100_13815 [Thermoanaerobaculia bacterium]
MRAALSFLLPVGLIALLAPAPASADAAVRGDEPAPAQAEPPTASDTPPTATAPPTTTEPGALPGAADDLPDGWLADLRHTVSSDLSRFYRRRRAMRFGGVLAGAGALANTDGDEEIQAWYREDVRSPSGDEWAADLERLGRMETIGLPLLAGGLLVGLAPEEGSRAPVRWLRRTARAYLVGTPALLYLQPLTGGNRPAEGLGSDWQPFVGQNGVSGHAFTGAVPFLTIARQTRRPWLRVLAVAASTAGGWAQFHTDQHYLSQFALGWWLAWEATDAIAESDARLLGEDEEPRVAILPLPAEGGGGVLVTLRF